MYGVINSAHKVLNLIMQYSILHLTNIALSTVLHFYDYVYMNARIYIFERYMLRTIGIIDGGRYSLI